jgi:hypothetical protein
VKILVLVLCIAAIAAPAAYAKSRTTVMIRERTPRVGQLFAVEVRTGYVVPPNEWLRLIAVAPGKGWYEVVGTVTGDSSLTHASIPRDGFEIKLKRTGPKSWRAAVRLPRPGRWRLVVPNGTHAGFMVPPPASWMPWIRVQG